MCVCVCAILYFSVANIFTEPCFIFQSGRSIEELAKSTNNQVIIEAVRRNRTVTKQDGQFVDLLSEYIQKDGKKSTARKQVCICVSL